MTASTTPTSSTPRLTLKVVSPAAAPALPTTPPAPTPPPVDATPPTAKHPARHRWLLVGAIAALGLVSLIPISYEVGGPVTLNVAPGNRRTVSPPIAGTLEFLNPAVQSGAPVQQGQVIARLRSRDLERDIAQVQQELTSAQQQLEEQTRKQIRIAADLQTAIAQAQALQQETTLAQQAAAASVPTQVQEIEATLAMQRQLLASTERELERYTLALEDKVISASRWEEVKQKRDRLAGELTTLEQKLASTRENLQREVKSREIQLSRQTAIVAAQQQIANSEAQVQTLGDRITHLQHRLTQLQKDHQQLTLRAPIDGVVITTDFDLKLGKELKPDQGLLEIVHLGDRLTGSVEIDEQDVRYVQAGKAVRFRLSYDKLTTFDARVERLIPNVKADQTGQKHTVSIAISVDNPDAQLQNGSTGYARIYSEQVPMYQKSPAKSSASSPGNACR